MNHCLKFIARTLFMATYLPAVWAPVNATDLSKKSVFTDGYPHLVAFRGEGIRPIHRNYEVWSEALEGYDVVIRKFWNEELQIDPRSVEWAQRHMAAHPEMLFLWHLNAESRATHEHSAVQERYFPGHWALYTGTTSKEPLTKQTDSFEVKDARRFDMKGYIDRRSNQWHSQDLVIVERRANGTFNWAKCEYAQLLSVDNSSGRISVRRGAYGSTPQEYGTSEVYIAPIVGVVWAGNVTWFYNHSTTCPQDANGKTASDHFVDEILEKLHPQTGDLRGFDGIAFDVTYWNARRRNMDVNADGIADNGVIEGKNLWQAGMIDWTRKLRQQVGDEFIIVGDSGFDKHQRAVGLYNGMESEGFPFHHDAYRGFSTPINHFAYWKAFGDVPYVFNFAALKIELEQDRPFAQQYARFALGTLTCLEVFATHFSDKKGNLLDEYIAGKRKTPHWLGKATSPLLRLDEMQQDLLYDTGVEWSDLLLSRLTVDNGRLQKRGGSLQIEGTDQESTSPITVTIPNIPRPHGDIVVSFEAKSLAPLAPTLADTRFPRKVSVQVDGLPEYKQAVRNNAFFNPLEGVFGQAGFLQQKFYFRDLHLGQGDTITIHLKFENQGPLEIRNLRIHNGAQLLAREFENGVILVNPSFHEQTFDLKQLFTDYSGHFKRIDGVSSHNDGQQIQTPSRMVVPSIDAVFLEK
ncbi:hypothetical protein QEH52_02555 [Coraliomargarita sp. SDUM461003]|uniref:Uncharacterized protein n=1 Tax=Thalassobacterium maritimum TaxID=3041265 RepID=A0ABU1AQP4_9BACT|nr:hypothetical protein [Coraliomargarita sp. SDUM461003]MDQ8206373.1 hypothetical protein [Coraliomargarita sp. SDUM461003]